MRKIRTNDEVIVIAGKYKGKVAKVKKVFTKANKALVDGVNIVKKHVKPNPQQGIEGGIVEKELPIHMSNLAIYNPSSEKNDRVKFIVEDGRKVRVFASTGEKIDI